MPDPVVEIKIGMVTDADVGGVLGDRVNTLFDGREITVIAPPGIEAVVFKTGLDDLIRGIDAVCRTDGMNQATLRRSEIAFGTVDQIFSDLVTNGFVLIQKGFDVMPFVFTDIDIIVDAAFPVVRAMPAVEPARIQGFQAFDFMVEFGLDLFKGIVLCSHTYSVTENGGIVFGKLVEIRYHGMRL